MAVDLYKQVSFALPVKSLARVDKVATELDFSRGKTLEHLIQVALTVYDEPVEKSNAALGLGIKNRADVAATLSNGLRKLL